MTEIFYKAKKTLNKNSFALFNEHRVTFLLGEKSDLLLFNVNNDPFPGRCSL